MVEWVLLVLVCVVGWRVVQQRSRRVPFVVPLGAAVVTVAGFADTLIAERRGDDLLTMWVAVAVFIGAAGVMYGTPWLLGRIGLLALLTALGIAVAYLAGGLVHGYGLDCFEPCPIASRIDELALSSFLLGAGFFVLALLADVGRRLMRR